MTNSYSDDYTAADIIADVIWTDEGTLRGTVTEAAQALKDSDRLMPDLPKPRFAQDGTPYWQAAEEVYQPSLTPGFIDGMDAYGETFRERVEDVEAKALAMLATVNYVKRNQK